MNNTREKQYPSGYPTLEELKHEIIERLNPIDVTVPSSFNPIYIHKDSSFAEMVAKLLTSRPDFFLGKYIDYRYGKGCVRINYYLFNDRIVFQHNHLVTLPKCPSCGNPSLRMDNDESFKCGRKNCMYYLPSRTSYDPQLHEKAAVEFIAHMIGTNGKARPIIIEQELCYYMLELFSDLNIVIKQRYAIDRNYELHFKLPKGFHIEHIDCTNMERKARTVLKAQIELNPRHDGRIVIWTDDDLIPHMIKILNPLISHKKIRKITTLASKVRDGQSKLSITLGADFDIGDI